LILIKPNILLVGAGGHASSCIDVIEQQGKFSIAGLIEFSKKASSQNLHNPYEVIGTDDDLPSLIETYKYAIVTVGQIGTANVRIKLYELLIKLGFQLPIIVSPNACISRTAKIGDGTIVMHGAIVNSSAIIGKNCIINSRALVEHDAKVGNHSHISTGAIINGGTSVGDGTLIGSGSILKQGIKLGTSCVVGMGLSVRHDLVDNEKFVG